MSYRTVDEISLSPERPQLDRQGRTLGTYPTRPASPRPTILLPEITTFPFVRQKQVPDRLALRCGVRRAYRLELHGGI